MSNFPLKRAGTGTREWSDVSYNIGSGCGRRCLYCYANSFKQNPGDEKLKDPIPPLPKKRGSVMFPTRHDISPLYLPESIKAIRRILDSGRSVLIVSKPQRVCIEAICKEFAAETMSILFRFTIGSLDQDLASLWEPGAPTVGERIACLKHARSLGFETSVSMEPMLAGTDDALATFGVVCPDVSEKIWVGKMNKVDERVRQRDPAVANACTLIKSLQNDAEILRLVKALDGHPKVEWKDSIKEVIARHPSR
jgi:hypothetical protein